MGPWLSRAITVPAIRVFFITSLHFGLERPSFYPLGKEYLE
jgi:hypothetical protein